MCRTRYRTWSLWRVSQHTVELMSVLESADYMRYALAISTTFSLLARLDRIVITCKTLLGESYHVSGIHLDQQHRV